MVVLMMYYKNVKHCILERKSEHELFDFTMFSKMLKAVQPRINFLISNKEEETCFCRPGKHRNYQMFL